MVVAAVAAESSGGEAELPFHLHTTSVVVHPLDRISPEAVLVVPRSSDLLSSSLGMACAPTQ